MDNISISEVIRIFRNLSAQDRWIASKFLKRLDNKGRSKIIQFPTKRKKAEGGV